MTEGKEAFLSRWSRLKRQQPEEKTVAQAEEKPAAPLPPVESLTPESDFSAFMGPKVKDELRRVALKKLFTDPHFNVADPFEPFSGDWTGEALPQEMLATLNQARSVLLTPEEKKALEEQEASQKNEVAHGEAEQDEPGRQDT